MRFGIIGAAAYIAPKHLSAIQSTGNNLVAALDPYDNVGVLDTYAPDCKFFTEFERFDRHVDKLKRKGQPLDWLTICSPNYLHDSHCRFGLKSGMDIICEKPLTLAPWNLDALREIEEETGKRVWTVLQLRHHPHLKELKRSLDPNRMYNVELTYMTPRGPWFFISWKGQDKKAGGLISNIGIHFLDLLIWLFGSWKDVRVLHSDQERLSGYLELERAQVKWYLSTSFKDLNGGSPIRSLVVDGHEIDMSQQFRDLHTTVYRETLKGNGHGIEDARPSVALAHHIQEIKDKRVNQDGDYWGQLHPFVRLID